LLLVHIDDDGSLFGEIVDPSRIAFIVVPATAAIIVVCLACAVKSMLAQNSGYRFLGLKGGALALCGFSALHLSLLDWPDVAVAVAASVYGLGLGLLGLGWGIELAGHLGEKQFKNTLLAVFAAGIVKAALLLLPDSALFIANIFIILSASLLPLRLDDPGHGNSRTVGSDTIDQLRGLLERNWVIYCGLLVCLTVCAANWGFRIAGYQEQDNFGTTDRFGTVLGFCLAVVVSMLLARGGSTRRLNSWSSVIPLICIAGMLAVWFITVYDRGIGNLIGLSGDTNSFISGIPIGFAMSMLSILLLLRMGMEAEQGLPLTFIIAAMIASVTAAFLLLVVFQSYAEAEASKTLDSLLKLLYLVIAAIHLVMLAQGQPDRPDNLTDVRIAAICRHHSLSKREIQMLQYILQGRTAPYIAEVEYISLNTVKSHYRRLYAKLGVHSKNELLNAVFGEEVD
jgi:DNA-binding CsgD family transcriptional regulator